MPPVQGGSVYSRTGSGDVSAAIARDPRLVYVPNGTDATVSVVDQASGAVLRTFAVGRSPEHVVASWDLRTLWVTSDLGNSMTRVDPGTGRPTGIVSVPDPYNLYFTPDGKSAVVVAERLQRLGFRDPQTMALQSSLPVNCPGIDHADFSGEGRYLIASCEFSARLIKIDTVRRIVVGYLPLGRAASPQDVRAGPDGRTFLVADQGLNALLVVDGLSLRVTGRVPGLLGAHGLYPSRDGRSLYVTERHGSAVSVLNLITHVVTATWRIPGGGSPDMGGVSIDGRKLWVSGRYSHDVYVFDTRSGTVLRTVRVGDGPHGSNVWPQPGRYSLGHTASMR